MASKCKTEKPEERRLSDRIANYHKLDIVDENGRKVEWREYQAEVRALEDALRACGEALEAIKAGLGDRLLAKGPLSDAYAHGVMADVNGALALPAVRAAMEGK